MANSWSTSVLSNPFAPSPGGVRYSLASLLLLTLVVALGLGGLRAGMVGVERDRQVALSLGTVGGALAGAVVGLVIGLGRPTRLRSGTSGLLVGAVSGLGAGLLAVLPAALPVLLPGSLLLLLFAVAVRRLSRGRAGG